MKSKAKIPASAAEPAEPAAAPREALALQALGPRPARRNYRRMALGAVWLAPRTA